MRTHAHIHTRTHTHTPHTQVPLLRQASAVEALREAMVSVEEDTQDKDLSQTQVSCPFFFLMPFAAAWILEVMSVLTLPTSFFLALPAALPANPRKFLPLRADDAPGRDDGHSSASRPPRTPLVAYEQ